MQLTVNIIHELRNCPGIQGECDFAGGRAVSAWYTIEARASWGVYDENELIPLPDWGALISDGRCVDDLAPFM